MKKNTLLSVIFLISAICFGQAEIQKYCVDRSSDFGELNTDLKIVHLKKPSEVTDDDIINYGLDYDQPGVFIGSKPDNFNGIVLGIHGGLTTKFTSKGLFDSNVYKYYYDLGYAVSFFATSAFLGDYYNGYITSLGIDAVTKHFGVEKMSLAGYSSGGVVIEVASFCYDKTDKIDKVYGIGVPFFGSEITDLVTLFPEVFQKSIMFTLGAATGATRPDELPKFINVLDTDSFFMQTTYYKKSVFRPFIDSHINNDPENYYMVRSGDFVDFSVPGIEGYLRSSGMVQTGLLLSILSTDIDNLGEFGKNDGITAYYSSKKPGSVVFDEFSDVKKNHLNLCDADKSIFAREVLHEVITKSNSTSGVNYKEKIPNSRNIQSRNIVSRSNYQISSMGFFKLDNDFNEEDSKLFVLNENTVDSLSSYYTSNNSVNANNSRFVSKELGVDQVSNILFKEIEFPKTVNSNNFRVSSNENSSTNDDAVYFLLQDNIVTELTVDYSQSVFEYLQNPYPVLELDILSDKEISKKDLNITVEATRLTNLYGERTIKETYGLVFTYNEAKDVFQAETTNQPYGIYSIKIRVNNSDFQRDLAAGYTVGSLIEHIEIDNNIQVKKDVVKKLLIDTSGKKLYYTAGVNAKTNNNIKFEFYDYRGAYIGGININNQEIKNGVNAIDYQDQGLLFQNGNAYFVVIEMNGNKQPYKLIAK